MEAIMRIRNFQPLRPSPDLVAEVACVPYDVVNREEASELAAGKPASLLHVDRAEIDLPPGVDPHSDQVYAKAVDNFRALRERGVLLREKTPSLYLYRQTMGNHVQHGLVTLCHVDDYENNIIKKHETTRRDKEDDRTRLIGALRANTGPVFLTYRQNPRVRALTDPIKKTEPLYDFTAPDGIGHTLWQITGGGEWIEAFEEIPRAYVADGHHRTASAARVGREMRQANPEHTGSEDYNWFLSVLFPDEELKVLPYNRCVHDLNGMTAEQFLAKTEQVFQMEATGIAEPEGPGQIHMYLPGKWFRLRWNPEAESNPVDRLDVQALQNRLLAPILGIDDPRTSERIDFIGGIRGTGELIRRVDSGNAAVAFSMHPTTIGQLMAISDAGEIMPPKSTWFEPKLRSGLVIHTF